MDLYGLQERRIHTYSLCSPVFSGLAPVLAPSSFPADSSAPAPLSAQSFLLHFTSWLIQTRCPASRVLERYARSVAAELAGTLFGNKLGDLFFSGESC